MASNLTPVERSYDIPSPAFPTPSTLNPVPETFEGNQTFNLPSSSIVVIGPWVSGGAVVNGSIYTYQGQYFKNITGTNTTTAPPSDTTNWALIYSTTVGVGTPLEPIYETGLPISYTTPDAAFPPPPVTPAGTLSGTPNATGSIATYGTYPNSPAFGSASLLTAWSSSVTYAKNNLIKFNLSVSAWVSGTTYAKGVFVTRTVQGVTGLTTAVFMSQAASNTGNDPAQYGSGASWLTEGEELGTNELDFEWWIPIALTLTTGTTYSIGFMSLIDANLNNTPAANSVDWQAVPEDNALGLAREGGPLTYPAQAYPGGVETEVWATNGYFGGGSTTTLIRSDATRTDGSLAVSPTSLSFAHTTTGTSTATLKDPKGVTVTPGTYDPGFGLVPNILVSSSDVTKATVAVVQSTGVITVTGVAAGSVTITVTWGGLTTTIPVTLS